jgi:hypothetical protein
VHDINGIVAELVEQLGLPAKADAMFTRAGSFHYQGARDERLLKAPDLLSPAARAIQTRQLSVLYRCFLQDMCSVNSGTARGGTLRHPSELRLCVEPSRLRRLHAKVASPRDGVASLPRR